MAVHIDGTEAVAHAHTGGRIAIDRRFHGDIALGELVAGLGIVGILIHRIQIDLNTKGLQLGLDHFRIAHMGLLCGVDRQRKGGDLAVSVDVEAVGILFGVTRSLHIFVRFRSIGGQLFGILVTHRGGGHKAPVGDLGIGTAEIGLECIIVQRIGNRLTQVFVSEQALYIVKGQNRRCIGRSHIGKRYVGVRREYILIGSRHTGGVGPDHVDVALLERQIHGIFVSEKLIDDFLYIGLLGIILIDCKGNGPGFFVEGFQHIGAAGNATFGLRNSILALINVLGHHAEGGHIAQFPDIGRGKRQGNAHFIVGEAVAGVLGIRDLSVFPGLGLKIGAAVGLIVLEGEKDVLRRYRLSIRPGHAVLNGKCPGSGILGSISCQKRMIFALGVLINQRQFGYTAGKHIEVILAEHGGFDGSRRADGQRINGVGGCRFRGLRGGSLGAWLGGGCLGGFCRGLAAGCQRQHHQQRQQKGSNFFHFVFFSF